MELRHTVAWSRPLAQVLPIQLSVAQADSAKRSELRVDLADGRACPRRFKQESDRPRAPQPSRASSMMSIDLVIRVLATITLIEMMVALGLGVTFAELRDVAKRWRLVARAMVANYVCVPLAAIGLLILFGAQPMVAAGFLVVAVCPGAPYGPPFTALARGSVVISVGLMVILAGSSAILAPLLLQWLIPVVASERHLEVNAATMVGTLALSQFLPMCIGLLIRHRRPALADRLRPPLTALSKLLNLILVAVVFAAQFRVLIAIRPLAYMGMLMLVVATLVSGWLFGGWSAEHRKSLAITTAVRNVGVSLVIAAGAFPGTPAITAATAYALFQTLVMALIALAWGRLSVSAAVPGPAIP